MLELVLVLVLALALEVVVREGVLGIVRPPTMATGVEVARGASRKGRDMNTAVVVAFAVAVVAFAVAVVAFAVAVWFQHLGLRSREDMARRIGPPGGHCHCLKKAKV